MCVADWNGGKIGLKQCNIFKIQYHFSKEGKLLSLLFIVFFELVIEIP